MRHKSSRRISIPHRHVVQAAQSFLAIERSSGLPLQEDKWPTHPSVLAWVLIPAPLSPSYTGAIRLIGGRWRAPVAIGEAEHGIGAGPIGWHRDQSAVDASFPGQARMAASTSPRRMRAGTVSAASTPPVTAERSRGRIALHSFKARTAPRPLLFARRVLVPAWVVCARHLRRSCPMTRTATPEPTPAARLRRPR